MRRLAACVLAVCCLFPACARRDTPAEQARRAEMLLLGNGAEPQDLDPHLCTAYPDFNILIALFEGLTCIDERTAQPVPGTAERWDVSADGLTYVFHLRTNARWSNGDPVTAEDFVFSFRRALAPRLACEYSYLLYPLLHAEDYNAGRLTDFTQVGVAALDTHTLKLTLGQPCPYLLSLAAHQAWFPVHRATIEHYGAFDQRGTAWTRPGHLVGNGPFQLQTWAQNSRIVVVRNARYWDAAHNRLAGVTFFPNDNIATDESNFRAGQLHLTWDLLPERIAHYRTAAPAMLRVDPLLDSYFLRFNVERPPLNDPRVRRALSRAIDREAIARTVLYGSRLPAYALTPPGTAGYTPAAHVPTDFAAARRLLAEAGYPAGKHFPPLEIQMYTDAINAKMLEAVQEMWRRELGISVSLINRDRRVWLDNQISFAYQISCSRWVGDYDDPSTYLDLFKSESGNNQTHWRSPEYDRLNNEANHTLDPGGRQVLLQRAEALLLDEAPIAPIFYGARTFLIQPYVHGWVPSLLGIHRYQYVWLE